MIGFWAFYYFSILNVHGTYLLPAVLSQRLGLGKAGLRMAPEEALLEVLQARIIVYAVISISICSYCS